MINSLKDLDQLLKICRKRGVTEINLGTVSLKLGDLPQENVSRGTTEEESKDPYSSFPQGELTPEQLMFYSAGGLPENDPYREQTEQ